VSNQLRRDPSSLRDPAGFVFHQDGRVRRAVTDYGLSHARAVRETGLIDRLIAAGRLLPETEIATSLEGWPDVRLVLEHPRLPFVSYPYEWPFRALQAAALLHLNIQLDAYQSEAFSYSVGTDAARRFPGFTLFSRFNTNFPRTSSSEPALIEGRPPQPGMSFNEWPARALRTGF